MGYLDAYGVADERRNRILKWSIVAGLIALVLGTVLYFKFRDYPERRQVERFLELLRAGDHKGAYALWGCTDQKPCPDYRFEKFMEDWGPQSPNNRPQEAQLSRSTSCETGLIQGVRFPGQGETLLWVERSSDTLSFAPWMLKDVPDTARGRFAEWMWDITRNCKPLIGP